MLKPCFDHLESQMYNASPSKDTWSIVPRLICGFSLEMLPWTSDSQIILTVTHINRAKIINKKDLNGLLCLSIPD